MGYTIRDEDAKWYCVPLFSVDPNVGLQAIVDKRKRFSCRCFFVLFTYFTNARLEETIVVGANLPELLVGFIGIAYTTHRKISSNL